MRLKFLLPFLLLSLSFQAFSETKESLFGLAKNESAQAGSLSIELKDRNSLTYKPKNISQIKYISGGLASIVFGGGLGHTIQGRRTKNLIFLSGTILFFIGAQVEFIYRMTHLKREIPLDANRKIGLGVLAIGSAIRIWEMIDVWILPSNYKIVKESPFQIKPLAFYDLGAQFHYGLSLNYRF